MMLALDLCGEEVLFFNPVVIRDASRLMLCKPSHH